MMKSNHYYQLFKRFERKNLTEAKFKEYFHDWWECRWLKFCGVMTDLENRRVNIRNVYKKLIPVDKSLWRFSLYDSFESAMMDIVDFGKEIGSLNAHLEYEDKIQELEKEALKVDPEHNKAFKKIIQRHYEREKANMEAELDAQGKDLQEFREGLQNERKKAGVTPYGGKGIESMEIFRDLIGELGEMLNPHFRGNPGVTTPHLVWPCAKAIAELLNSYFVNLKVNFNADQVRKSFDSYIEKN